jgi:hypothetical protein
MVRMKSGRCLLCDEIRKEIRQSGDRSKRQCYCGRWHPDSPPPPSRVKPVGESRDHPGRQGSYKKYPDSVPEPIVPPHAVSLERLPWPDGARPKGRWSIC